MGYFVTDTPAVCSQALLSLLGKGDKITSILYPSYKMLVYSDRLICDTPFLQCD